MAASTVTAVTTNGGDQPCTDPQPKPVLTGEMAFLQRDALWEHEKPYKLGYEPVGVDLPRSNHKLEIRPVNVYDVRSMTEQLSIDHNGFEVHPLHSNLQYEEFFDPEKVGTVYLKELQELVMKICQAKQAIPLDAEIRCRHETFPVSTGKKYEYGQPSFMTHIDVTVDGVREIVKKLYPNDAEEILKSRIQMVTVWKPLQGPVVDWPLAVCDARTLGSSDIVPADVVYQKVATENYLVHFSEDQRWYYISQQESHEALVFKAADSDVEKTARCAHGSFSLGDKGTTGRQSVDSRVLVMHADIKYPQAGKWAF